MKANLLILFVVFTTCAFAQQDTTHAKKYSIRVAADFKLEESTLGLPEWTNVWGAGGDIIIQNKKNIGIMCGFNYRQKYLSFYASAIGSINYAIISINFRKDTKVVYFGAGIAGELFTGEKMDVVANRAPNGTYVILTPGYVDIRKINLGINGFIGIDKAINRKFSLFVQGQFLKDVFSPLPASVSEVGTFLNCGTSLGLDYCLN